MAKWAAMQRYTNGCGYVGCYGLESREAAIAWLQNVWDWSHCYYLSPSWEIWELRD